MIGQSGCVPGKRGSIRAKWLFLGKVVVFGRKCFFCGQSGCIRETIVLFPAKWLYLGKVVVFVQGGCYRGKVVLFGKK